MFTNIDPVPKGNDNAYIYPNYPMNGNDYTGDFGFSSIRNFARKVVHTAQTRSAGSAAVRGGKAPAKNSGGGGHTDVVLKSVVSVITLPLWLKVAVSLTVLPPGRVKDWAAIRTFLLIRAEPSHFKVYSKVKTAAHQFGSLEAPLDSLDWKESAKFSKAFLSVPVVIISYSKFPTVNTRM